MRYYVARKSLNTGRVEVKRTKCSDCWCSLKYLEEHPNLVWKFSESGAKRIVKNEQRFHGWVWEHYLIPAGE